MTSKIPCKFYPRNCINGVNCKFSHETPGGFGSNNNAFGSLSSFNNSSSAFGGSNNSVFGSTSNSAFGSTSNSAFGSHNSGYGGGFGAFGGTTAPAKAPRCRCKGEAGAIKPCMDVVRDDLKHYAQVWPLSCYGHESGTATCLAGDVCFEEVRMCYYTNPQNHSQVRDQVIAAHNTKKQGLQNFNEYQVCQPDTSVTMNPLVAGGVGNNSSGFGAVFNATPPAGAAAMDSSAFPSSSPFGTSSGTSNMFGMQSAFPSTSTSSAFSSTPNAFSATSAFPSSSAFPSASAFPSSTPSSTAFPSAFPSSTSAFPSSTSAFPSSTSAFPSSASAFPSSTSAFPSSTSAFPSATSAFPSSNPSSNPASAFPSSAFPSFPPSNASAFPSSNASAFPSSTPSTFPSSTFPSSAGGFPSMMSAGEAKGEAKSAEYWFQAPKFEFGLIPVEPPPPHLA